MTRAGFVSLIGPPNAGKSTLMNTVVGHKVSIVTPRFKQQDPVFVVLRCMMNPKSYLLIRQVFLCRKSSD